MSLTWAVVLAAPLVVAQRQTADLPGLDGRVQVRLGDITRGQVWLTLEDRAAGTALHSGSTRDGDVVRFTVDGRAYVLTLERLENRLIGTDLAHLRLDEATPGPPASGGPPVVTVAALLADLGRSQVTFLRNGAAHTAAEAEAHLRRKAEQAGLAALDVDAFIERVASKSSTTGLPYRVRHPDGREEDAADWLRSRAAALGRPQSAASPAAPP